MIDPEIIRTAVALAFRDMYVFPVRGKIPVTEHGFADAITAPNVEDADAVRDLFAGTGATGIGVDCGRSGLLVVDFDGPKAQDTWTRLILEHGIVGTLEVATGRPDGGRHLWFRTSDERSRNTVKTLGPGLDTRGAGGYVVCPPSAHPSGANYRWLNRREIAPAPEWLLAKLAPPPPPPIGERRALGAGARLTAYGRAALDGLADTMLGAAEGARNETLLEVARRAGRLEAAGEIEASLAEDVLVQAGLTVGLSPAEVEKTFRSGFEFGRQYPALRAAR